MKTHKDVLVEGSTYELSLEKIAGMKIKDVKGYISNEWGDPIYTMTRIVMEDGSELGCEGEHDMPYLTTYPDSEHILKTEEIENIYKTNPDYKEFES